MTWPLLTIAIFLFLVLAIISPFETLGWWSGWSKRHLKLEEPLGWRSSRQSADQEEDERRFIVFFTGINGFDAGVAGKREKRMLAEITSHLPEEAVLIEDVFPYSVSNNPLNGERLFLGLWQWLDKYRKRYKNPANVYNWLIILRNLLQVAVAVDPRYGPLNSAGVAREVAHSLYRHGYSANNRQPLSIVCYSGGAQIAVGIAPFLRRAFDVPIYIYALGGVISDTAAMDSVEKLVQIRGTKDPLPWAGAILFPGRWPISPHSAWNRAQRQGRILEINPGPLTHFGRSDYFARSKKFDDGTSYVTRMAEIISEQMLTQHEEAAVPSDDDTAAQSS